MVFGERCRNVRADGRDQRVFLTHGQRYCAEYSVGKRCPGFGVDEQQRFRPGWRWGVGLVIERGWCPRPDSNRHALRRGILSPLRLPIPPLGQVRVAESNSWREVGNYTQVFPPLGGLKNHLLPPYTPDTRRVWHVATRPPRYVQSFI